jgi:benzoate membrane transport protein
VFIVWASGAVSSIGLCLYLRQPVPITWTIPGLIYLGTLAGEFTFAEMVGANLVAGVLILVLGVLGMGGRIMAWLPLPIIMGMFAGSILGYITRLVTATVEDLGVAGAAVAGFMLGRLIRNPRVPPVGLAVIFGGAGALLTGSATSTALEWRAPVLAVAELSFDPAAILAISLPMVILAMGMGNVQGLGFLISQGYRVPVNRISVIVGVNSIVNAVFGGHPAIVARTGVAIMAGKDAGPKAANTGPASSAPALTLSIAFGAGLVATLLAILSAILSAIQDAFEEAFGGTLRFGGVIAFAVGATPFAFADITSAFWAIVAGLAASLIAEREELLAYWRRGCEAEPG